MQIGLLYPYNKKQHEEEIKANKQVSLGIDPQSFLDDINVLEINYTYETSRILAEIKLNLMKLLGKVQEQSAEENKEEKKEGEA
jgi:hypothetical protein